MSTATAEPARAGPGAPEAGAAVRNATTGRRADLTCLLVPCGLAALLVLLELGTRSLWLDEGATIAISSQHGAALWHAIAHDGGNMLGYYLFEHALIGLFGHAPALVRAPSAFASVVTVGLVGVLGLRLFDRRVALAAGMLAAVSLPLVFWGQDARAYAPMITFITASFLALSMLLEPDPRRVMWVAWAVSLLLAVYMSFVAVLVIPAQVLILLIDRRAAWRSALVGIGAVLAAAIPIAVLAADRGSGQLFWVPAPTLARFDEMLRWVTSSGMPPNIHRNVISAVLLAVSLVALVTIIVRALVRPDPRTRLLLAWLLVPLALILVESLIGQPVALARTSLVALPAASLLLAASLLADDRAVRLPLPGPLAWGAVALIVLVRAAVLIPTYGTSPENWRRAASVIAAAARPGDCAVFYPLDGWMVFNAYSGDVRLPASALPDATWGPARPYVERYVVPGPGHLAAVSHRCRRVWLVASHEGQRDGPAVARAHLASFHALQASLRRVYGGASAEQRFGWAAPVRVRLYARG